MSTAKLIAVDTETTVNVQKENGQEEKSSTATLFDGRDWLVGISTAFKYQDEIWSCYFPFRHESDNLPGESLWPIKTILESGTPLIFHNAKFDFASLFTIGIIPTGDFFDTLAMAHMVNEEFPSKALDWLSKVILKEEMKEKDRVAQWAKIWGWNSIPPNIMAGRACEDATNTYRLQQIFYREMAA
jgi:DNA polymerase I-like protein with 3'-5' exonuclease and polymerase domains